MMALASVVSMSLPVHTLDGEAKSFPADADQPRSVFVVTFTKAASEKGRAWTQKLREAGDKLRASVFQVSVIEDVPKMFRSSATSGMAHSVPAPLHAHFWVAASNSDEWQRCTASQSMKDPYVFVIDRRDQIVWRGHGEPTDAMLEEIEGLPPPEAP